MEYLYPFNLYIQTKQANVQEQQVGARALPQKSPTVVKSELVENTRIADIYQTGNKKTKLMHFIGNKNNCKPLNKIQN